MDKFLLGCCYYPEHWKMTDVDSDFARIKDLGFNVVRMGEFSWAMYEPREGEYDFSCLEYAVKCALKHDIKVILGTPTAAPPKWLIDKYPEVLCAWKDGTTMFHGSRQHHNHTSKVYLEYCAKITERMAEQFKDEPNVIGWQIDNELNCHRSDSYSESDDKAFRVWLKDKYKTIDALNEAWGNRFWSLMFSDFEEIHCPRPMPAMVNPSWQLDFIKFTSDSAIAYAKVQSDILRRVCPNHFITHNGLFGNLDIKKLTDQTLDFMSFDSYPAFYENGAKGAGRDMADKLSMIRGCSNKFLVLEQQSGPGGQNSYLLPTPKPGQIRLWTYQSIANGAYGVLYFRYRTALYGAEELWYGIYDHDLSENDRSREIRQVAKELSAVGDIFTAECETNRVAILNDYSNIFNDSIESFVNNDIWNIFDTLHARDIHADYIYNLDALKEKPQYKVVILPHIAIADENMCAQLEEFASGGGIVIVSARSGSKDRNNHYYPMPLPGVFTPAAGCTAERFTTVPDYEKQYVLYNGKTYEATGYYETLKPTDGEAVAYYTEDVSKGKPAVVKKGNIYYIGFYANGSGVSIYEDIIREHIAAKTPIDDMVETYYFDNHTLYLNFADYPVSLDAFDMLSGMQVSEIPPYGVVMTEKN